MNNSILFGKKEMEAGNEESFRQALTNAYAEPQMSKEQVERLKQKMLQAKQENRRERRKAYLVRAASTAAALAAAFIVLPNTSANIAYAMEQIPVLGALVKVVTLRDYDYESDRHTAHIHVPEISVEEVVGTDVLEAEAQEKLNQATAEINAEIEKITEELIAEFKSGMQDQQNYQDILVTSEVLTATEEYFTLKLLCYRGAGSGYAWNHFYTIDLQTGERLKLKDLFLEGADFVTPISENIKTQMREQMAADDDVFYWLEHEIEAWNFKSITPETNFYLNAEGNIVIGFNEGDVAPMYMGAVEFEIPAAVLKEIIR